MAVAEERRLLTAADLARLSPQGRCELVRGELREMTPPGGEHARVESRADQILGAWEEVGLGVAFVGEVGILVARGPDTVRGADCAFYADDQLPYEESREGYLVTPPALVVEVLSKNDTASDVQEKVMEYLDSGVRTVWVIDPQNRSVSLYRSVREVQVLRGADLLTAPDIDPTLSHPVEKLFAGLRS